MKLNKLLLIGSTLIALMLQSASAQEVMVTEYISSGSIPVFDDNRGHIEDRKIAALPQPPFKAVFKSDKQAFAEVSAGQWIYKDYFKTNAGSKVATDPECLVKGIEAKGQDYVANVTRGLNDCAD